MIPWLKVAFDELDSGIEEIPGEEHHPQILAYHLETSLRATSDEVPWCSAFVCYCMEMAGVPSTRSAAARSWLEWGTPLEEPREGCVVVFWRGKKISEGKGHVGFWVGEEDDKVSVLGGNQGNAVSIKQYPMSKVLGYRWPRPEYFRRTIHEGSSNTH